MFRDCTGLIQVRSIRLAYIYGILPCNLIVTISSSRSHHRYLRSIDENAAREGHRREILLQMSCQEQPLLVLFEADRSAGNPGGLPQPRRLSNASPRTLVKPVSSNHALGVFSFSRTRQFPELNQLMGPGEEEAPHGDRIRFDFVRLEGTWR